MAMTGIKNVVQNVVPRNMTVKKWRIYALVNEPAPTWSLSLRFTLNGVSAGPPLTIANPAYEGEVELNLPLVYGDLVGIFMDETYSNILGVSSTMEFEIA